MFSAGLFFAVGDARAPGAPRRDGVLVATELLPGIPEIALLDCAANEATQRVELRFERITTDPDADEMRQLLGRGVQRTVDFEWNAETGELAYAARAAFMPQAVRGVAISYPTPASCESR